MITKEIISKTLEDVIKKTHDGTSLGKLREPFKKFNQEYGSFDHEVTSIFDKDGNEIWNIEGEKYFCPIPTDVAYELDGKVDNSEIFHINHNHPICYNNVPVILSLPDTKILQIMYDNGLDYDYVYNSISATSDNGSTMTLIKNNNFTIDDENEYANASMLLDKVQSQYLGIYKSKVMEYMDKKGMEYQEGNDSEIEYYIEKVSQPEFLQEAEDNAIKEVGRFEDYLEKEGVYSAFEKANTKLRIRWWNK